VNYYNEWDKRTAAWLRELIKEGLISDGIVDERSICDVQPSDLDGFAQCHFFAGIGGWSYALRLAGWPDDRPVWTASLPCQPFSTAGKGKGAGDDRHLWPIFSRLIEKHRPNVVFGEQVARAIGFNWLDGVSADLEEEGYAVAPSVLGAHSAGSPHIRQRLYWLAYTGHGTGCAEQGNELQECDSGAGQPSEGSGEGGGRVGNANGSGLQRHGRLIAEHDAEGWQIAHGCSAQAGFWGDFEFVHCTDGKARRIESGTFPLADGFPGRVGLLRGYGNAIVPQVAAEFIQAAEECIA
jgi:DNA (cytosine-5)-methyltransferase 1